MANQITSSTQLSTFSVIKGILQTSTLLSKKFRSSDYYEFEPKRLGHQYSQVPYIVINIPTKDEDLLVLNHGTRLVDFSAEIILAMDYEARSNMSAYASEIITSIEDSRGTLEAKGYHDVMVEFDGADSELLDSKNVVVGTFAVRFNGYVC